MQDIPSRKLARATDPDTSKHAAIGQRGTKRAAVLKAIARAGAAGLNVDAAARLAGQLQHDAGKRISDLINLGLVEPKTDKGVVVTQLLESGRHGRVYVVTTAGLAELVN